MKRCLACKKIYIEVGRESRYCQKCYAYYFDVIDKLEKSMRNDVTVSNGIIFKETRI